MESPEPAPVLPLPFADALKPDGFASARARFLEHFGGSSGPVVVDLSEASSVDFFGLQVLVGASKWASARKRAFSAVGAPESLRTLCRGLCLAVPGVEEKSA